MNRTAPRSRVPAASGPVTMLQVELQALRRELRATLRAYAARLEFSLAETSAIIASTKSADELSRDELHKIRDLRSLISDRKVKPEKGRRKDLRKLDTLIEDLKNAVQGGQGA